MANATIERIGAERSGIHTEWRRAKNSFKGCIEAKCPFLAECTNNPRFQVCPIKAECFAAYNPPERAAAGHNTLSNAMLNKLADLISVTSNALDLGATKISVGTSTAATSNPFTQLTTETHREAFVDVQRPSTGKVVFYWFLSTTVANATLTEWGFLAGAPTGTLGTGTLLNRWKDTVIKTDQDTVSGQYSITFAGA